MPPKSPQSGADGAGTSAGVVALDGGDDDVGRQLAMHCVAARPLAIDVDGLPPSLLEAERVILEAQLADSAKPAARASAFDEPSSLRSCVESAACSVSRASRLAPPEKWEALAKEVQRIAARTRLRWPG